MARINANYKNLLIRVDELKELLFKKGANPAELESKFEP